MIYFSFEFRELSKIHDHNIIAEIYEVVNEKFRPNSEMAKLKILNKTNPHSDVIYEYMRIVVRQETPYVCYNEKQYMYFLMNKQTEAGYVYPLISPCPSAT
jgi:hypothetical protein